MKCSPALQSIHMAQSIWWGFIFILVASPREGKWYCFHFMYGETEVAWFSNGLQELKEVASTYDEDSVAQF